MHWPYKFAVEWVADEFTIRAGEGWFTIVRFDGTLIFRATTMQQLVLLEKAFAAIAAAAKKDLNTTTATSFVMINKHVTTGTPNNLLLMYRGTDKQVLLGVEEHIPLLLELPTGLREDIWYWLQLVTDVRTKRLATAGAEHSVNLHDGGIKLANRRTKADLVFPVDSETREQVSRFLLDSLGKTGKPGETWKLSNKPIGHTLSVQTLSLQKPTELEDTQMIFGVTHGLKKLRVSLYRSYIAHLALQLNQESL